MQPSDRMQQVQTPIIPTIGEWIQEYPDTISFAQGSVNYPPPPQCRQRLEGFWGNPANHRYKLVHGLPELKEKLAEKLRRENGIEASENQDGPCRLCVTAGGNMAFVNAVLAVTNPDDEIVLLAPYYFNHEMAIEMAGARPVTVPTDEEFQPILAYIEQAVSHRTRAVVTVSPNNPSGAVYSQKTLQAINALCRECGVFHIHDEAYEYFVYEDAEHVSPGAFDQAAPHTISLFSFSKAYGMPGWRMGYMVYPSALDEAVRKAQDTILICPPVASQFAALGALEAGKAYCLEQQQPIRRSRQLVIEALNDWQPFVASVCTRGAFYFLLKIFSRLDEMKLVERLIREYRVAVIPGRSFGFYDACYLRLSYGALTPEQAQEGMARLAEGLQTIMGELL